MNQIQRLINSSLMKMEKLLGNPTFIWLGETFNCVPNSPKFTSTSIAVGYMTDEQFSMEVRLNQFTSGIYPQLNQYITFNGNSMLITGVTPLAHGQSYIYYCKIPNAALAKV